jgi:hypothetical protein
MGARQKPVEVIERAVFRVDVEVVGDVVAMVFLGRGIERSQPDRVDAKVFDVVESRADAGQIADAIIVRVGKAPDIDLVEESR